eukprot:4004881-Alexandrium_andersonii.AAC.1
MGALARSWVASSTLKRPRPGGGGRPSGTSIAMGARQRLAVWRPWRALARVPRGGHGGCPDREQQ